MEIVQYPNEILIKKCPAYDIEKLAEDIASAGEMQAIMEPLKHCAGLAAPQVGIARRFFVMRDGLTRFRYCFDPVILSHGKDAVVGGEGCMSLGHGDKSRGGIFIKAPRWRIVTMEYINVKGVRVQETFKSLDARVCQHEVDHLNGWLIIRTERDDEPK